MRVANGIIVSAFKDSMRAYKAVHKSMKYAQMDIERVQRSGIADQILLSVIKDGAVQGQRHYGLREGEWRLDYSWGGCLE